MKKASSIFSVFILLFLTHYCFSQPNLVLLKAGNRHHFYYQVGDRISYRDKVSSHRISGKIMSLTDSTLELEHAPRTRLTDIRYVYRTRHFFAQAAAAGVVVLGVFFPISVANRAIQKETPIIDDNVIIVNGSMLAVSGISAFFVIRKIPIDDKWHLKVLDFGRPIYE